MFFSATSGDRHNNNKFSSCSVQNISHLLDAIADNRRKNCFKATNGTFRWNKIIEKREECDCGYDEHDCEESCCYPRLLSAADRRQNSSAASSKGYIMVRDGGSVLFLPIPIPQKIPIFTNTDTMYFNPTNTDTPKNADIYFFRYCTY